VLSAEFLLRMLIASRLKTPDGTCSHLARKARF
jgi:hypothetical protein